MDELFNVLGTRSFNEIQMDDLTSRNFSKSDANQSLQGLKFLGLIDSAGKTTDLMSVLALRGDVRKDKLSAIVKDAYKKIFETVTKLEELKKDDLYNEFIANYKLSKRLASTAMPVFIWLCKEAGISLSEDVSVKKIRKDSKVKSPREAKKVGKNEEYNSQKTGQEIKDEDYHTYNLSGIILMIPKSETADDAIAAGALSKIREEIINFAEASGLKKPVQPEP